METTAAEYQKDFMLRAIQLSEKGMAQGDGGPFGAVIVRDGAIIAEGWNRVLKTNDPTAHAEVTAIRAACSALGRFDLSDCELYTSCEPCPMCLGAIYWARPKAVYFANTRQDAAAIGFDDAFIYDELNLDFTERSIPFTAVAEPEAIKSFKTWQSKSDRTMY